MEAGVELFFGLIMALNLSNTLRFALIGQPAHEIMIITIAILGCNLAWGMVDGVLNIISEHTKDMSFYQLMFHLKSPLP